MIAAAAALLAVPALASASTGPSGTAAAHATSHVVAARHPARKHPSRLKVHANPRTAIAGTRIRLSARVSTWRPAPKGRVTFYWEHHRKLCSARVHHGWARCTTEFRASGVRVVKGVYSGDSRHRGSAGRVTVRTTRAHTWTTVAASTYRPNPGQAVTLAATVHSHSRLTPTGKVRFTEGSHTLCAAWLHGGKAHCSHAWTGTGQYHVVARYYGDRAHFGSHREFGVITVVPAPKIATTTVITSIAPNPLKGAGKSATVTVTVSNKVAGAPAPTGTVTVAPTTALPPGATGYTCTVTLTGGTGTCTITPSYYGVVTYDAAYSGDSTHAASKYTGKYLVTVPDTTTTTVAFSPAAGTAGKPDTITATVTSQAGDNISPSAGGNGTVKFTIGGTAIPGCSAVALSYTKATGNTATCSYTPASGTVTVTAAYSGDAGNLGSSGTGKLTTP